MYKRTREKAKEGKKDRQILESCQKNENLWNMEVILIPIVVGGFVTYSKNQEKRLDEIEIRGRIQTICTTKLTGLGT